METSALKASIGLVDSRALPKLSNLLISKYARIILIIKEGIEIEGLTERSGSGQRAWQFNQQLKVWQPRRPDIATHELPDEHVDNANSVQPRSTTKE